jgi:hypothetical protein
MWQHETSMKGSPPQRSRTHSYRRLPFASSSLAIARSSSSGSVRAGGGLGVVVDIDAVAAKADVEEEEGAEEDPRVARAA